MACGQTQGAPICCNSLSVLASNSHTTLKKPARQLETKNTPFPGATEIGLMLTDNSDPPGRSSKAPVIGSTVYGKPVA